jgi:primosomal protein N' (replication factor Y)
MTGAMTGGVAGTDEQLALVRAGARAGRAVARARGEAPPVAAELPIARVAVDVSLAHLDRAFDYLVPADAAETAVPGARVRVRFAGRLVDGFVLARAAESAHGGRLARLHRVVSAEPVLTPEILALARAVGARYAGTLFDVLRLAVPPRHARVEAEPARKPVAPLAPGPDAAAPWAAYDNGPGFLEALAERRAPRAVWAALPGSPSPEEDWPAAVAAAVVTTLATGRGALVVVPDLRDVQRVGAALDAAVGPGAWAALTADLGPAERYRRWLAVRRGAVRAVVGTRAAMFAPVADLGLVVSWDDGDDLHAEPRAPYPHVREVLCLRAHAEGAAALIGGHAVTAEAAALLESGWAHPLAASRATLRRRVPRIQASGEDAELARDPAARSARLPSLAWQVARAGLAAGPVLVQVPRRGYLPGLACVRCRGPARCVRCAGPLSLAAGESAARCGLCGWGEGGPDGAGAWACPECASTRLRAVAVGAVRTAEELGRAFPGVVVRSSGQEAVLATVGPEPALVVATPGAEPIAEGGYAAALLLDAHASLRRPDLRAAEEALRRWANAVALVRPGDAGGQVVLVGDAATAAVQALVRWDPAGFARRELADRRALGFPPATRLAVLTGPPDAVADLLALADLPAGVEVLGPVPVPRAGAPNAPGNEDHVRALVRVPRAQGGSLVSALRGAQGVRSARKTAGAVRIQVDPIELG